MEQQDVAWAVVDGGVHLIDCGEFRTPPGDALLPVLEIDARGTTEREYPPAVDGEAVASRKERDVLAHPHRDTRRLGKLPVVLVIARRDKDRYPQPRAGFLNSIKVIVPVGPQAEVA